MRARNIKPGLFDNEVLGEIDPIYTLLFIGLWTLADREGRLEDRPKRIKAKIFRYRETPIISEALDTLVELGFIERYTVDETHIIQIINFCKHQNPHKNEKPSKLPENSQQPSETQSNQGFKTDSSNVPIKSEQGPTESEALGLIPDTGFLIPDSGYRIPDSGYRIPDSHIPESGNATDVAEMRPHGWLDWLFEKYGYLKHRHFSQRTMSLLQSWCTSRYTKSEVDMAVQLSREKTGKEHPPIAYVTEVLLSNRELPARSTPRRTGGQRKETPAERAKRMVAEEKRWSGEAAMACGALEADHAS